MELEHRKSLEQEYAEIDYYLQKAQDEIGEALSSLSPTQRRFITDAASAGRPRPSDRQSCPAASDTDIPGLDLQDHPCSSADQPLMDRKYNSLPHPRKKAANILEYNRQLSDGSATENSQSLSVDFHSIFGQDVSVSDGNLTSLQVDKPLRPQTIAPPARLPKCCNFRNRDWRFYVSGNFNTNIKQDGATECFDPLEVLLDESSQVANGAEGRLKINRTYSGPELARTSGDVADSSHYVSVRRSASELSNEHSSHRQRLILKSRENSGQDTGLRAKTRSHSAEGKRSKGKVKEDGVYSGEPKTDSRGRRSGFMKSSVNKSSDNVRGTNGDVNGEDGDVLNKDAGCHSSLSVKHTMDPDKSRDSAMSAYCASSVHAQPVCVQDTTSEEKDVLCKEGNRATNCAAGSDVLSHNVANRLHLNGYVNDESRPRPIKIKTNGCLMTKRSTRDRRLRARSDPSKMATKHIQIASTHQVASVQTDGPLDGILSPTVDRRRAPTTALMDAMDLSGHTASTVLPSGAGDQRGSGDSARVRSQSADRVEQRRRHREKSQSPQRRGHSPDGFRGVSKVSRSTQTHRSVIKYGSVTKPVTMHVKIDDVLTVPGQLLGVENADAAADGRKVKASSKKAASSQSSSSPSTISSQNNPCYVCEQCEMNEAAAGHKQCSCASKSVKIGLSSSSAAAAAGSGKMPSAGSSAKASSQSSKCSSSVKVSSLPSGKTTTSPSAKSSSLSSVRTSSSSSSSVCSSVSASSRVKANDLDPSMLSAEGKTVVFVPSRESRRIYIRPQMPVIVEDVSRTDEDPVDERTSDCSSLVCLDDDVKYYGSLKIQRSVSKDQNMKTTLSKSASEVYKQHGNEKPRIQAAPDCAKVMSAGYKPSVAKTVLLDSNTASGTSVTPGSVATTGAKTLLDSMHRKYCANQYKHDEKAKSEEMLTGRIRSSANATNEAGYNLVQHSKSTTYLSDNKLRLTVSSDPEGRKSPGYGSFTSSPPGSSSGSATSPKSPGFKSEGVSRSSSGIGSLSSNQSQKSSPSPEEHHVDPEYSEDSMLIECCDPVTPECDIKSFQMMLKSDKECAEIEAIEACKWLRAAGFPQYAQMYEEHQFPIDINAVERDHDFLDNDSLQSLFRRLNTLNKCATMKIEAAPSKSVDDSDDEDTCALSDKWKYQRSSRRWSRKDLDSILPTDGVENSSVERSGIRSCSSHDSVITDNDDSLTSQQEDSPTLQSRSQHQEPTRQHLVLDLPPGGSTGQATSDHVSDSDNSNTSSLEPPVSPSVFKRSASEKLRNARHTFFRRMESLKSRRGSSKNKSKLAAGKLDIGAPVLVNTKSIQERMDKLGCMDISPSTETSPNPSLVTENADSKPDNDSVFLEDKEPVISKPSSDLKHRNFSESAVHELSGRKEANKPDADALRTNGFVENGDRQSQASNHTRRTGSFGFSNCGNYTDLLSSGMSSMSTSLPNGLPESNNNDEKEIKLRQKEGPPSDNRLSVYDNVPEDHSDAVRELDMIVQSLMQDISELNATWGMTQSGNLSTPFPIDITLEEAILDFTGDRDSTLTRKSKSDILQPESNIPLLPVEGTTTFASRSSSSSTISHSTSGTVPTISSAAEPTISSSVLTSSDHHNQTDTHQTNISGNTQHRSGGELVLDMYNCNVQSSHIHLDDTDDMLDTILQSLESQYGAQKPVEADDHNLASEARKPNKSSQDKQDSVIANIQDQDPEVDSHSGSVSNPEMSDVETTPGSREEDGSETCEIQETRERRDSGVGSSLTREPSDRRRYRIRWHSFAKSHRPSFNSRDLQINSMSAGQLKLLRKFSLLKITALMEKYSMNRSGWNWVMPMNKFMRRFKMTADYKDKNVFGVPLQIILQRTGQALPQCMLHAMRSLRKNAHDAVGIFRKSGVRSRIQKLRDDIEADPESVSFDSLQAYDVADVLKQYFRELPECLLTNKLSETFISIFTHVPHDQRLEALYAAVMLLPDENREVLQSLLLFLSDMADYAKFNQMNASNLAVCFAPSLFHICGSRAPPGASPKRYRKKDGIPDQRELQEQKAAHECLTEMIVNCKKIFMVPADILRMCHFSYMDQCMPVPLEELGHHHQNDDQSDSSGYIGYLDSCIQGLLKESRDKFKGWVSVSCQTAVDLAYKKIDDGYSLRLWKCSTEIEAPPCEVLTRVCNERQLWDEDLLKWRVVETLDKNTEVFQYVLNNMAPHPTRDICELRHWRTDLPKGACVLVSTSVEHQNGPLLGGVRAVVLASRYLIEPCGSGKSRLTHISRVDLRGHTPEWYNKVYGHLCVNYMNRIKDSFCQKADGPETNV